MMERIRYILLLFLFLMALPVPSSSGDPAIIPDDLHRKAIVVDLHCDALIHFINGKKSLIERSSLYEVDLPRLAQGGVDVQVFAIFADPYRVSSDRYAEYTLKGLKKFQDFLAANKDRIELARSSGDTRRIIASGRLAAILSIEGAHALGGNLKNLSEFKRLGVSSVTLTWNNSNEFADAAKGIVLHNGLSEDGRKLIRKMNSMGMIIDVSHLSPRAFWQVMRLSASSVIASHSNARALCNNARNLTDEQIKAIASYGGTIGVNFHSPYLRGDGKRATLSDVLDQIDYISRLVGTEHVSIGSDFDGYIITPEGLSDATCFPALTEGLRSRGYSPKDITDIMGENFLRVFEKVERSAKR